MRNFRSGEASYITTPRLKNMRLNMSREYPNKRIAITRQQSGTGSFKVKFTANRGALYPVESENST